MMRRRGQHPSPANDWIEFERNLQARLESWSKSSNLARDEAERARSRAEADRNAATEARDRALGQLVQETARRGAAEEAAQHLEAERTALAQALETERATVAQLHSQLSDLQSARATDREALQISDAECRSLRNDLDAAAKDIVALRRESEKAISAAQDTRRQLETTRTELASMKEEARTAAARAAEGERRAKQLAEEARRSVSALRSGVMLQEGLRAKAEIGMQEAAKELTAAQDAASAVAVERRLLQDRVETLMVDKRTLLAENERLSAELAVAQQQNAGMDSAARAELEEKLAEARKSLVELQARVESLTQEAENAKARAQHEIEASAVLERALEEAAASQKEIRSAWHHAENTLHEMSRARAEAEQSNHRLTEALVRERACRILAQQHLEDVAANRGEEDGGVVMDEVDKARLALMHDEMTAEHRSLELILEALKEMRAQTDAVDYEELIQGGQTTELGSEASQSESEHASVSKSGKRSGMNGVMGNGVAS
jgi:chromosome segregation ATPase